MRIAISLCFAVLLGLTFAADFTADAQSQSPPLSAATGEPAAKSKPLSGADYSREAVVFEHLDKAVHMNADGTGDSTVHVVVRLQSEQAAREMSVLAVAYASAYQTGTIEHVRVHKPDGSVVETPEGDSREVTPELTREAPLYSDLKDRQMPVRSLSAGDTMEYDLHVITHKPEAPGTFWGAENLITSGLVVLSQTVTLTAPKASYVQVWSPKWKPEITEAGNLRTWKWSSSQLKPTPKANPDGTTPADDADDDMLDGEGRRIPSIAWTTFHSWAEVGAWYRSLAYSRAEPNAALRARAEDLTRNAKTPEEQVRALYEYVSAHTRYIGINFGVGRFQPHSAAEILANQYGDCKDKDTLLEALLRAKGFSTAPALIGAGIAPLPDMPSPAIFNHVITTVEVPGTGRVWLDATQETAPYRLLSAAIRNEEALVVPATGDAALQKTPAMPPYPMFETMTAEGTLSDDGVFKGHMRFEFRSDSEPGVRMVNRVAPAQWDAAAQYFANAIGFSGTVSNTDLHPTDMSHPVVISWDYKKTDFGDWPNLRILPLFPTLEVTAIEKDKGPKRDIDLGSARTLEAHTVIHLPPAMKADPPDAMHVKKPYATYDQTYHVKDGTLYVDRKVVILQRKVPKADWKDYYEFTHSIGMQDGESYIRLVAAPKPAPVSKSAEAAVLPITRDRDGKATVEVQLAPGDPTHGAAGAAASASASDAHTPPASVSLDGDPKQLLVQAQMAGRRGDLARAQEILLAVKQKDPNTPYLMSFLGWLASREGKSQEAIDDYKLELAHHPDANSEVVGMLAWEYSAHKRYAEAVDVLKQYSDRKDQQLTRTLAGVQLAMKDYAGAAETLQAFTIAYPRDRGAITALANAYVSLHRPTEAAAAAHAAMDGSDDPMVLNSNSYILSEIKLDLPFAEERARHAIEAMEAASAQRGIDEVNNKAFADASNLTATWDTLGWILFEQGKTADAEPYVAAAWLHRQDVAVGYHLGQIYEAEGKREDALRMYDMAAATEYASQAEDYPAVQEAIARLQKGGVKDTVGNAVQMLQDSRTYHVAKVADVQGWGTVRVQIDGNGIHASQIVSGPDALKPMTASLNSLAIPSALPPGSKALLLRDGVLSCTSEQKQCVFVLMPRSSIRNEAAQ